MRPQVDARDSAPKLVKSSIADTSQADLPRAGEPQIAFEHLHKGLVEYQTRYIENGLRAAGLALLMIGWILTSESARSFVKSSTVARWAAVAGIALAICAYLLLSARMMHVMQHLGRELAALNYLPTAYYVFRIMPTRITLANVAIAVAPSAVAIAIILFGIE